MKYRAISNDWSRIIHGADSAPEALRIAVKASNDCLDHTDDICIYTIDGEYLLSEEDQFMHEN